jgi:hypothetical protein
MELKVMRVFKKDTYTIGNFFIDNVWLCNTLEDKVRIINNDCSMKIYGQTAIPEGKYNVEIVWWEKHQKFYPIIKNVPCFEGILIHAGSSIIDTDGCILIGFNKEKGKLQGGLLIMEEIRKRLKDQKDITITIE